MLAMPMASRGQWLRAFNVSIPVKIMWQTRSRVGMVSLEEVCHWGHIKSQWHTQRERERERERQRQRERERERVLL